MLIVGLFSPYWLLQTPVLNGEAKSPQNSDYIVEADKLPSVRHILNFTNKKDLKELIHDVAVKEGIDYHKFLATAICESFLVIDIIGDDGNSIGLWQIHLPSHPGITKEQALDPVWATHWSAIKFKENPRIWGCYTKLYG